MAKRKLIERYILRAILPYTLFSLVLLTTILFAQQTGRYFETIFHGLVPSTLVYSLALALLPTVLVFTIPMAMLAGKIIGLCRMARHRRVVAVAAAGHCPPLIVWPPLALGPAPPPATFRLHLPPPR